MSDGTSSIVWSITAGIKFGMQLTTRARSRRGEWVVHVRCRTGTSWSFGHGSTGRADSQRAEEIDSCDAVESRWCHATRAFSHQSYVSCVGAAPRCRALDYDEEV